MKSTYTDYLIGVLIATVSLNAWYLMSVAIENKVLPENYTFLRDLIVAVAGAFMGAFFAFLYSKSMDDKKAIASRQQQDDKDAAFLNSELLNLGLQREIIENYKRQYEAYSCLAVCDRAFNMRAEKYHGEISSNNLGAIALVLTSEVNLLLDIGRFRAGYINMLESIKIRNDFFVDVLQPEMKKLGLLDRKINVSELDNLEIGIRRAAITSVNCAYQNVLIASEKVAELSELLHIACKNKYPNYPFIKIGVIEVFADGKKVDSE